MSSVNYRGFAWINDDVEHTDSDYARANALARRWSELHHEDEQRAFQRMADYDDGRYYGPEACEECEACISGDGECEQILATQEYQRNKRAEKDLEIELVEDKLDAIGARMMRPYEHWNEDERYMQYMESDRYGDSY